MQKITLFWHRRDLRLHDNAGLYHALKQHQQVLPLFIFDRNILDLLEDRKDARLSFIHDQILRLKAELESQGSSMIVKYGKSEEIWNDLLHEYEIEAVYTNRDYESYAIQRDETIQQLLEQKGIPFHSFKDHVIFEKEEILKKDGTPYKVFTPYSRNWRAKLDSKLAQTEDGKTVSFYLKAYPTASYYSNFKRVTPLPMISLAEMGFEKSDLPIPPLVVKQGIIRNYDKTRDIPSINGTSKLGIHFRFGTISIRQKALKALSLNATYLSELIWRDFYSMILSHFPHVEKGAFKPQYERIEWRNKEDEFERWCAGKTGYPIVDAGMRELNATGYMHNRVRMITASFLTKHLLIDWRWGEAYFAKKLLDFDLASNNGGWQWASGSGTDAAPYFRIFNPWSQQKKFDPDFKYIRKWVVEYGTPSYAQPMVDHKMARERCLAIYKATLSKN